MERVTKEKNVWMTVDPGTVTGWAHFYGKKLHSWGTITGKGKDFIEKSTDIVANLKWADKMFVEWPSFQTAIGVNTQSINKLCFLIGRMWTPETVLIPVNKWRGTCPKEVLWHRAEKYFGLKEGILHNHEGDAVAMGEWVIKCK